MKSAGPQDGCYLAFARSTDDPSLCDRIVDAGLKSSCTGEAVLAE